MMFKKKVRKHLRWLLLDCSKIARIWFWKRGTPSIIATRIQWPIWASAHLEKTNECSLIRRATQNLWRKTKRLLEISYLKRNWIKPNQSVQLKVIELLRGITKCLSLKNFPFPKADLVRNLKNGCWWRSKYLIMQDPSLRYRNPHAIRILLCLEALVRISRIWTGQMANLTWCSWK